MHHFLKGNIVLENNSITNCTTEILRSDNAPMPTFNGEKKHDMVTFPAIVGKNESRFKKIRKSRRNGSINTNISSDGLDLRSCDYCLKNKLQLQGSSKILKVCEACKMTMYCSSECQLKDWKIHEPNCDFFVKTKLAAREGIKANQTKQGKELNKTEDNDGSGDYIYPWNNYCSIL